MMTRTASSPSAPPASASAGSWRYSGGSSSIAVDVRRETVGQQFGDVRARDEHALVHVKTECSEPRFTGQIRRGDALVDPARKQRRELRALLGRQARVEKGLRAVERKMQRVQQQ